MYQLGGGTARGIVRKRGSLADQAYAALKRDIISCVLRPGQVIVESELAARYGMSKTPIREALNLLRKEGFVEILPRRGTLVKPVNVQDVQHTFFLRMLLEPEAAALAAQRATGEQLKAITDLSAASDGSDLTRPFTMAERLRTNRQFHVAIAEASGVARLAAIVTGLHEEVERFYNMEKSGQRANPGGLHHHELTDAIVSGDAERARLVMIEAIKASRLALIEALIEDPRTSSGLSVVGRPA